MISIYIRIGGHWSVPLTV